MVTFPFDHVLGPAAEAHFAAGRFIAAPAERRGPRNCCHGNVDREVAQSGGRALLGWQIEWWPGLFVRALHHVVVERPGGELIDVTGLDPGDDAAAITFAPAQVLEGAVEGAVPSLLPGRYFVIADAAKVHEMIAAAEAQREIKLRLARVMIEEFGFSESGGELIAPDAAADRAFLDAHHDEMARSVLRIDRALAGCGALAARLA